MKPSRKLSLIAAALSTVPAFEDALANDCSFLHNLACITPESICWPAAIGSHEAYGQCLLKFDHGYCLSCSGFNDPRNCSTDNSDCTQFSGSTPTLWPSDPAESFGNSAAAKNFSGKSTLQAGRGLSTSFATAGSLVVEATTDAQKRVYYTWWVEGSAGKGWKEFDGNGQAASSPAIALSQTTLFATMKQADGYLYLNQGDLAQAFSGWQRLPFQSKFAPAMSASMNLVVIVAADTQGRLFYSYWTRGSSGTPFLEIPGVVTNTAPAAAMVSDYLFVVVRGLDGNVYLNQGELGKPFVGWQQMGIETSAAPSASSANGNTIVVVRDRQDTVRYNWWPIGQGGHWEPVGGRLPIAPASILLQRGPNFDQLAGPSIGLTTRDYVYIALPDNSGTLSLNQGDLGKPFIGWSLQ